MSYYTSSLEKAIKELAKFPGIGIKSAEKLAFYVLKSSDLDVETLCHSLLELKSKTRFCRICFNISEESECSICKDTHRNHRIICVVELFRDIISIEKTQEYKGLFHVLMGHISPIEGIDAADLKIGELVKRVKQAEVEEVILATNPNVEGDATSFYIADILKPFPVKVTRIACGLPIGGDLEFADSVTLSKSILKREVLSV